MRIGFGISKYSYGGKDEILAGIGQENMLSGAICRDQSCLVFKRLEQMKKGLDAYLPLSVKRVRRCQVTCVDDTDFYTNGSKYIEIM